MFLHRFFYLVMVMALITACAPQVAATPNAASTQAEPITLRLAVADEEGRPSDPYVHEFIDQVKKISNGSINVEPTWDAGSATEAGFETGVIQLVKKGDYDLGLAGSRAFDNENITSFQALQAPFLIDNDALAQAVATSDIATRMLENLSSTGVVGLTMWPEDLRHPFSLIPGKPILTPEDFVGKSVRATPSQATYQLITAMGGAPMMGNEYQAAESGLRQGASLTGTPTATGNVVFFAKFQVMFANGPAFEKLSDAQRATLHQAVLATQKKAIAEHPSDVDAAKAWCADGGSIVLASAEQVADFEAVAQPVLEQITQDPLNAKLIAAIRELKAKTQPSPGVQACGTASSLTNAVPTAENQVWSHELPPSGVWRVELSPDDFVRMGVMISKANEMAGTQTWTIKDGHYVNLWEDGKGNSGKCIGTYTVVEDFVRLTSTTDDCPNEVEDFQWRLDADGLHIHILDIKGVPFTEVKASYEAKPWQKVSQP